MAVFGFVGAAVAGLFTLVQRWIHEGREDRRVSSRVLVDMKVGALVERYTALDECYKTLCLYEATVLNSKIDSENSFDEVVPAYEVFVYALAGRKST